MASVYVGLLDRAFARQNPASFIAGSEVCPISCVSGGFVSFSSFTICGLSVMADISLLTFDSRALGRSSNSAP